MWREISFNTTSFQSLQTHEGSHFYHYSSEILWNKSCCFFHVLSLYHAVSIKWTQLQQ